jgi:methylglutaconyl-CoA hydratase
MSQPPSLDTSGFQRLELEREDDLLWVRLADPKRANAFSPEMIGELYAVFSHPWRDHGVRALLLAAEGKNFSAGADLGHLESLLTAGAEENLEDSRGLRALFESVLRQEALTLALVQGWCVAGGCGLATACDFVVAAENAHFMYSEVKIGFVPALVATYLPLRLRGAQIRELLLNPEPLSAREALAMGLANRCVADDQLPSAGRDLAVEILTKASSQSIAHTKSLLLDNLGKDLDQALAAAVEANASSRATDDCRRGITTFLETKKPPSWR